MTATNMHFVPMFRILLNVHAKMAGKETELVNLAAAVRTTLFCSCVGVCDLLMSTFRR
jgi:hypothetical protein